MSGKVVTTILQKMYYIYQPYQFSVIPVDLLRFVVQLNDYMITLFHLLTLHQFILLTSNLSLTAIGQGLLKLHLDF